MTMFDRRMFLAATGSLLAATSLARAESRLFVYDPREGRRPVRSETRAYSVPRRYRRQIVRDPTGARPGTIVVDPRARFLYLVLPRRRAVRYGVGVGRQGMEWSGRAVIRRKAKWPRWTPTKSMIRRDPRLAKYAAGMPGGVSNPLGARALYLYEGGRDTLYRIHGTNEPWSIGRAMSSGCIRMLNKDVVDLFQRTPLGTPVIVRS